MTVSVEDGRTEPPGTILPGISIDLCRALQKGPAILEKIAVVVQSLHIDFKTALSKLFKVGFGHSITLLGNNLKRRLDASLIVHIHDAIGKVAPLRCFDIVSHDGAGGMTIGPEPYEGNLFDAAILHCQHQHFFMQDIHASIDRPGWE